jgi:hypothetical protein
VKASDGLFLRHQDISCSLPDATSLLDVLGIKKKVKRQPETKDNAIYRMPVYGRVHKSALLQRARECCHREIESRKMRYKKQKNYRSKYRAVEKK